MEQNISIRIAASEWDPRPPSCQSLAPTMTQSHRPLCSCIVDSAVPICFLCPLYENSSEPKYYCILVSHGNCFFLFAVHSGPDITLMDLWNHVPHRLYVHFFSCSFFPRRMREGGNGMTCMTVHCTRMDLLKGFQCCEWRTQDNWHVFMEQCDMFGSVFGDKMPESGTNCKYLHDNM